MSAKKPKGAKNAYMVEFGTLPKGGDFLLDFFDFIARLMGTMKVPPLTRLQSPLEMIKNRRKQLASTMANYIVPSFCGMCGKRIGIDEETGALEVDSFVPFQCPVQGDWSIFACCDCSTCPEGRKSEQCFCNFCGEQIKQIENKTVKGDGKAVYVPSYDLKSTSHSETLFVCVGCLKKFDRPANQLCDAPHRFVDECTECQECMVLLHKELDLAGGLCPRCEWGD